MQSKYTLVLFKKLFLKGTTRIRIVEKTGGSHLTLKTLCCSVQFKQERRTKSNFMSQMFQSKSNKYKIVLTIAETEEVFEVHFNWKVDTEESQGKRNADLTKNFCAYDAERQEDMLAKMLCAQHNKEENENDVDTYFEIEI